MGQHRERTLRDRLGGEKNRAHGFASFEAGYSGKALHDGSFVWSDYTSPWEADSIYSNGVNQFLIRAAGGVGIGTASPDRQVTVANDLTAYLNIKDTSHELLLGVDSEGAILSTMTNHDMVFRAGGNVNRILIKADGSVGIGNFEPAYPLHVNGVVAGTNFQNISDGRHKKDV